MLYSLNDTSAHSRESVELITDIDIGCSCQGVNEADKYQRSSIAHMVRFSNALTWVVYIPYFSCETHHLRKFDLTRMHLRVHRAREGENPQTHQIFRKRTLKDLKDKNRTINLGIDASIVEKALSRITSSVQRL